MGAKEEDEFYNILKIAHLCLNVLGIRTNKALHNNSLREILKGPGFLVFNMICILSSWFQFLYSMPVFLMSKNFKGFFVVWPCSSYTLLALSKTYATVGNTARIKVLLERFEELHLESINKRDAGDYEVSVKREFKYLKVVQITTIVSNVVTATIIVIAPLLFMLESYLKTNQLTVHFVFPVDYPFLDPYTRVFDYIIVYIHGCLATLFAIINMFGPDTVLYFLCSNIHIQFQELGRQVARVLLHSSRTSDLPARAGDMTQASDDVRDKLVEIILRHQELLSIVTEVDSIYSKTTLVNFVVSSVVICVTGFNIVIMESMDMATYLTMLCSAMWQVFHISRYGDLILRANSVIGDCITRSDWHLQSKLTKTLIMVILVRIQKPCRITAFMFLDVDLSAFRKVLSTSWSYFALLNTVYSRK